ncbi:30S ribosomal protein S2 [Deltaproteobacteria bacterium]|nr:30S ribosomal protein S2 [Deltaproteobacteria bacterium]
MFTKIPVRPFSSHGHTTKPFQGDFMAVISMKTFLEAGVHFGHQTKRWHPNMAPYIYGIKNGVHVIDLRQTLSKLKEAYEYVKASAAEGRVPLFVGTKTQIQRIVKEEAERCGSPYINFRWLGGLLTNFGTVKQSIARMKTFEEIAGEGGSYEGVIKKEALMMERKRIKLERSLGGVRNMKSVPSMLFITDCHKEQLALKEAFKLRIPVIGVADTNCDPTGIDYVIPGNDDSPRAVALYANIIATAVMEGLAVYKLRRIEPATEAKPAAKKSKPKEKNSVQKQTKTEEKSQKTLQKVRPAVIKTKTKAEDTEKKENDTDVNLLKADTKEKISETKDADDTKKIFKKTDTKEIVTKKAKAETDTKKSTKNKASVVSEKVSVEKPATKPKTKALAKTAEAKSAKLASKTETKKTAEKTETKTDKAKVSEEKKDDSVKEKKAKKTETEK